MRVVHGLVQAVERAGVPRDQFIAAARLGSRLAAAPEARVERSELLEVAEIALDLCADPAFGLHWAEWVSAQSFGLISQLLAQSTTLRAAFDTLFHFGELVTDDLEVELIERGDEAELRSHVLVGESLRVRRLASELTLLGLYNMLRDFSPPNRLRQANFDYPAPSYRAEYTRLFEGTERFDRQHTGMTFDRTLLDCASPHHDEEIKSSLLSVAEQRLSMLRQHGPHSWQLRSLLARQPAPHRVAMKTAAGWLDLSLRSLQRRLSEEGQSYTSLAHEASTIVARRMLAVERRTIQETAFAMGFSEVSSFHRAFKRWTGTTPTKFRS
jgi:AraC-like DNA-binding protein